MIESVRKVHTNRLWYINEHYVTVRDESKGSIACRKLVPVNFKMLIV